MSNTLYSGYDSFTPDPGDWDGQEVRCKACDHIMDVRKNRKGPTCYAMAMAKSEREYDHYVCPNSGKDWHTKVIELLIESKNFKSKKLQELVLSEVKEILSEQEIDSEFLTKEIK